MIMLTNGKSVREPNEQAGKLPIADSRFTFSLSSAPAWSANAAATAASARRTS